jgi:hypothetical protein
MSVEPQSPSQSGKRHQNGVRQQESDDAKVIPLPATAGMERNLLCVPHFVLNPKAARALSQIFYDWKLRDGTPATYAFSRTGDNPFPQTQHALYLDILLAMFAVNYRDDGLLYFRVSDVLRAAGKDPYSRGAREAFIEAVRRYMNCHVKWEHAFVGRLHTWAGAIIGESNLWDKDGLRPITGGSCRNPRNARDKEKWHTVRFHQYIVDSIRDGHTRIVLTSIMGSGIKHDAFCVYRYFYGFSDQTEVTRSFERLMQAFPWTGRETRFAAWIEKQLKELLACDLIAYYSLDEQKVTVKCKPIDELQRRQKAASPQGTVEVVDEDVPKDARPINQPPRQGATKSRRKTKVANLTDEALLAHYFALRDDGKLDPKIVETVDDLVHKRLQDIYLPALRSYLGHAASIQ